MNERIGKLLNRSGGAFYEGFLGSPNTVRFTEEELNTFVDLIVRDYTNKTIQGLMSDPAFAQAMDEYYEQKWAHRFD